MTNAKDWVIVMQDHDIPRESLGACSFRGATPSWGRGEGVAGSSLPGGACALGGRKVIPAQRTFVEGLHTRKRHRKCLVHDTGNTQGIYDDASWY